MEYLLKTKNVKKLWTFHRWEVYANYLEDIQSMRSMNALFREDITVTAEDKIITLVTCIGNQPSKRLLVQAVLEQEEIEKE